MRRGANHRAASFRGGFSPWSLVWILRTAIAVVFSTFRSDVRPRFITSVPPSLSGRPGSRSGTDRGAARRSFPGSSGERLVDGGGDPRSSALRAKAVSRKGTSTGASMGRISRTSREPGAGVPEGPDPRPRSVIAGSSTSSTTPGSVRGPGVQGPDTDSAGEIVMTVRREACR